MSRQTFVFKDLNYGASKTSTTKDTALTPYDLKDGAIGIYGISRSNNAGYLSLIVNAASSAGSLVKDTDFDGNEIFIYQGTSDGCRLSSAIKVKPTSNITSLVTQAYVAGTLGVSYVGFNATSGSLNFPSVISKGDEIIVIAQDLREIISGTTIGTSHSGYAQADNASEYEILTDLVANIYAIDDGLNNRNIDVDIVSDLAGTSVVGNSATCAVVFGSAIVTTSADALMVAGDYVELSGVVYKVLTDNGSGSFTVDRPYRGATATLANAACFDQGATAPTEVGLRVTDRYTNDIINISVAGIAESATNTKVVDNIGSTGLSTQVLEMENKGLSHRGFIDQNDRNRNKPATYSVAGVAYDLYTISYGNTQNNSDGQGGGRHDDKRLNLAFDSSGTIGAGQVQGDFQDILTTFYPDFVALS